MPSALRKVNPGDPLEIPAAAYNAFVDAASYVQARRHGQAAQPGGGTPDADVVLVKNLTGTDVDRFGVMCITGVVFSPTDNPDGFKAGPVLEGSAPQSDLAGRFVIAAEPIAGGQIGRAWAGGVCVASLNITDESLTFADTAQYVTATLKTFPAGAAEILWKESGTGSKLAVIRLANRGRLILWGKATSNWVNLPGNGSYVDCNPCEDKTGANPLTGTTVRVYLPRATGRDPNVREGQVIGYAYDEYVQRSGEDKAPEAVCLTPCDDDAIGTVKMWHDPATVLAGWQVVSKGRFPVGYDDGDADYNAVGKTGGFKKHGQTENDHPDHAEHTHPIPVCEQATLGGGPFTPSQFDTGSQNEIPFRHTGDADNRPPFEVWVIIKRVN